MILVELEIEDYKQFAGVHRFTPSPEGIIGIIGHNGAGKTTLFEAIEWCLYQPREINANEIPPRGQAAKPRVKLTLLNPDTGIRYVIYRSLNRQRIADAEIYREDEPESRIVQGSRATSEYVAKTLIGLSHRAFVSTFFTRQKELTFFGDLKETERRREVGRLLGMETIREAQKLIAEDRTEAQQHARALEIQAQEAVAGRDFPAELALAEEQIGQAAIALAAAELALQQAESAHAAARIKVERLAALEREDSALASAIERTAGDVRAAEARRQSILSELGRMDEATAERAKLAAVAALVDRRRAVAQAHEVARERFQNLQRLRTDLDRTNTSLSEAASDLKQTVASVPVGAPAGWAWNGRDDRETANVARQLAEIAGAIDAESIELECGALTRAVDLGDQLEKSRGQLTQFQTHLERLEAERRVVTAGGDPHARRDELAAAREERLRAIDQVEGRLTAVCQATARLQPVLERLRAQEDGAICPTCGRPIEGNDIAITIGLFSSTIASLLDEQAAMTAERAESAEAALRIGGELKTATEQAQKLDTLRGRIADGEKLIAKAATDVAELESRLGSHLASTGLSALPSIAEIDAANAKLTLARKIAATLPVLRRIESAGLRAVEERQELAREIAATGEVAYDAAAHEAARQELRAAESAVARMAQIDTMLTVRSEHEAEIATLDAELARLSGVLAQQRTARAALAFDPGALALALETERQSLDVERTAREARSTATNAVTEAERAREALIAEHARIADLVRRADTRARQAGELDTMYREFNGFEQFVADRLTPQLSDYTSELLRAITDGKYDQVLFTSNYGIEVFDGTEEHFPVDEFSGGERDVIALCARLALSRLIGSQANNPPGFMVLDEVFGSLDRERRTQVLDALGSLAGAADAYRQLFIISHVDDVRASPIFNEVWRVSEGADGVSHLENLTLSGGFEEA
jgi:exonuclease SbcC